MVTSAQFQFLSSWPGAVSANAHGEHLDGEFPTPLTIAPATPTPANPVGLMADNSLSQSWIGLDFKKTSLGINLGRIKFEAGIRYLNGPAGQATAVVAPRDPGDIHGWDYFIWVLAGPEKLQSTLNSIIRANTDAFIDFVAEHVPGLETPNFSLKVTSVHAEQLGCTFAAVCKQGHKTPWNMDLVFNFYGTVNAEGNALGLPVRAELKVKNLVLQLGVTIDTTKSSVTEPQVPDVHLHRLQCSVDGLEGLPGGQPGSYYAPGLLNSTYNKEVLDAINEKLREWLPKLGKFGPLERFYPSTLPKIPPSPANYQEWMSKPSIQAKRLSQLKIPGTHDSAAYTFDEKISHILYDELKILANLRKDEKAPPGHKLDDLTNIYIGPEAYSDLIRNIMLLGQAHHESKTIKKQLEDGIRFFDLRIYRDKDDNDYYTQHTLRAPRLKNLVTEVREFLSQHNSSQEFIILEFAQSWFPANVVSEDATNVANLVRDELGPWLYVPSDAPKDPGPGLERYNFQKLADVQLSLITNGSPKVLVVSRDDCIYPHSVLNVNDESLQSPTAGSGLSPYWFTAPPTNEEVVGYMLLNTFNPSARVKVLQHASYENNSRVKQVVAQDPPVWRYMMDWYTESKSGELPVDIIIEANH
ncbi:PI-PLC X domain-containing protein 2 [Paramyrothecium foliicola]|nr:PI-PLC X domain-containing protein 2 [Paramyrothecium foliicola]